jgi:hypothetical protein
MTNFQCRKTFRRYSVVFLSFKAGVGSLGKWDVVEQCAKCVLSTEEEVAQGGERSSF